MHHGRMGSCILQIFLQQLLEALQLHCDLHFADAHRAENPAGDSVTILALSQADGALVLV
jgi:hypothetical protein